MTNLILKIHKTNENSVKPVVVCCVYYKTETAKSKGQNAKSENSGCGHLEIRKVPENEKQGETIVFIVLFCKLCV